MSSSLFSRLSQSPMLRLALPVVLGYLGIMAMPLVDLLAVGRVSAVAVGAVGIGSSIFAWIMMVGLGLLSGLEYLISHSHGAGTPARARAVYGQGILASLILGVPGTLIFLIVSYFIQHLGITEEVRPYAASYLRILSVSLAPLLIFTASRNYLQGRGIARPIVIILIVSNLLNALANYVLVLGHWGFAAYGSDGSAWATVLARFFMMGAALFYVHHVDTKANLREPYVRWNRELMGQLFKLGAPAALHNTFEVGVFALATLLAGGLTATALAAHQIALNTASMTFMVPLGLASSTAVLVGQSVGRGDLYGARRLGWQGIALGVGFMSLSGLTLWQLSGPILSLYTSQTEIVLVAQQIMLIVALFQISDGAQVVAAGALRGLGNTRTAAITNFMSHWLLGLPVGVTLCYRLGRGLSGLWTGLALGLTTVAVILIWRWSVESRAHASLSSSLSRG